MHLYLSKTSKYISLVVRGYSTGVWDENGYNIGPLSPPVIIFIQNATNMLIAPTTTARVETFLCVCHTLSLTFDKP